MEQTYTLFMEAMAAAVRGRRVEWQELSEQQLHSLMQLAGTQFVLPMIYEAVYSCPALRALPKHLTDEFRNAAMTSVVIQSQRTMSFLEVYRGLRAKGLAPLVVKGLVCRCLYPSPDSRQSSDEDLLILAEDYPRYHEALTEAGFSRTEPERDPLTQHEVAYRRMGEVPLLLEMHKQLFEPDSDAYGDLNRYFADAISRSVAIEAEGEEIRTMCPSDHLLYLVLHAYKHFLHSGFGLRQLCDICLFAETHGHEVDWVQFSVELHALKLYRFVSALFTIGLEYFEFSTEAAGMPEGWLCSGIATEDLLLDLLGAGVYGASTMSRKHSANMTLGAVAARNNGGKVNGRTSGVLRTLFPSAATLRGRYTYLEKHPVLLPVAWTDRILTYYKEQSAGRADNRAAESLRIGRDRIELLREYGILD